eukprot:7660554-Prorocentrum_lima.AAC.1
MTSSLVGSEMCIRDREWNVYMVSTIPYRGQAFPPDAATLRTLSDTARPVSYTHLTLPTICSV